MMDVVDGKQYLFEPGFFFEKHGDELLLGLGKWHYYDAENVASLLEQFSLADCQDFSEQKRKQAQTNNDREVLFIPRFNVRAGERFEGDSLVDIFCYTIDESGRDFYDFFVGSAGQVLWVFDSASQADQEMCKARSEQSYVDLFGIIISHGLPLIRFRPDNMEQALEPMVLGCEDADEFKE